MAQLLIRDLSERVVQKLKKRAKREGRSLQAEVARILEETVQQDDERLDMQAARALCDEIRARFRGRVFEDSVQLIREDRDR